MSYHIYTTEGIVLKNISGGEGDAILYILTRDFGLILAKAVSIRSPQSKLRPFLTEYSFIMVSVIRAKNGWKITNVSGKDNFYFDSSKNRGRFISQISSFLTKMIVGEMRDPKVFECVLRSFVDSKNIPDDNLGDLEILTVFRLLYLLGYIEKKDSQKIFLDNINDFDSVLLSQVGVVRKKLVGEINSSLQASHL